MFCAFLDEIFKLTITMKQMRYMRTAKENPRSYMC